LRVHERVRLTQEGGVFWLDADIVNYSRGQGSLLAEAKYTSPPSWPRRPPPRSPLPSETGSGTLPKTPLRPQGGWFLRRRRGTGQRGREGRAGTGGGAAGV